MKRRKNTGRKITSSKKKPLDKFGNRSYNKTKISQTDEQEEYVQITTAQKILGDENRVGSFVQNGLVRAS